MSPGPTRVPGPSAMSQDPRQAPGWAGQPGLARLQGPAEEVRPPERAVDDLELKSEGRLWSDRFALLAWLRCSDGRGLFLCLCSLAFDEASRERREETGSSPSLSP